jgi:hypothetical protein
MTKPNKTKRNRAAFKKVVKYINNIHVDEEGNKFPEYNRINIATSGLNIYDGASIVLATISRCALNLIIFCGEDMDNEGIIRNDSHTKSTFKSLMDEYTEGKVTYTENSINMAFTELTKKGLLISKGKGLFKVNPIYIWRNSTSNRLATIKQELEIMDKETLNAIVKQLLGENHDREKD